ncbi:MAG TPA: His/Gly/Thr/Pro-type tRNA ligase C-terminal domain-containing protein, partial [Planctomycetaceae bacterium]
YGIGVNRIIAALAETCHDEKGLIWPVSVAPFEAVVIPLNVKDEAVRQAAETVYRELTDAGVDVLLDDRDERPGVKFNDADLIGFPVRVVVGGKGLAEGVVEVKRRTDEQPEKVPKADALKRVREMLGR